MPNQMVLAWEIDVKNTTFGPVQAAAALAAVPLYTNPTTDPVLGQNFGLTVASDVSMQSGPSKAKRTLTLNMTPANTPSAPPPFPCHPDTSTSPVLPYPLRKAVTLPGSFFVSTGSAVVQTAFTQIPSLPAGSIIQFLAQQGVFYKVLSLTATSITLTAPYTGITGNSGAFKQIATPLPSAAIYSSSDLDTNGVATVPPIPAGSGAREVLITYKDSTGIGTFTSTVFLTGKRPVVVALSGGIDIAEIVNIVPMVSGAFGNNVGQLTLVELSEPLPTIQPDATPFDFRNLTDEAQGLISRALAYIPPSYFALSQQQSSAPQLEGEFELTTGAIIVPTSVDQTGVLFPGYVITFADDFRDNVQLPVDINYTIFAVTPKNITLTKAYRGLDTVGIGPNNNWPNNVGTRGLVGKTVSRKPSGATLVSPSPATTPDNDHLAATMGQFVNPGNAAPPPNAPLDPQTMQPAVTAAPGPAPNFLSGLFTRTLQLAIAGVPVVPQPITFV